ncbi:MAG: Biofilm dispersion protein BdlA [Crocinitomicaceae bacterium]|jgi:signal transduction histidine kinase|nr:Biofilm dispersion protein BdlA [Crocinitomicaceae bacterium]
MERNTSNFGAHAGNTVDASQLMNGFGLEIQSLVPELTEKEQRNIITYYELNKAHAPEYQEEALKEFQDHPVWGPIISGMSMEMMEAQNKYNELLQEAAIYKKDWLPYLKHLVEQGAVYARMGVNFKDWVEVVLLARKYFVRMLEKDHPTDAEMVLNCTQGMNHLTDIALYAIGESYVIEEKKKVEQKRQEYTHLLEVKNTQLVDFCNIVSHNLRAPLANIMMLIDFIDHNDDEEEKKEVFTKIRPVVNHLSEVFNELVESVQVRQDTDVRSSKLELEKFLKKTLQGFEAQIQSYKADIKYDFTEAPEVIFPPKYLDSLFTNLISNALKYKSPDRKPVITLKSEKTADGVILSVADNGLGIDLNMHKHNLFKIRKVFHKHPDAKGFGLFMVKTQVEAMRGNIWVESTPGTGSTFFVEFKNETDV